MINLDDPEAVKDSGKPSAQKKRMTCDVNECDDELGVEFTSVKDNFLKSLPVRKALRRKEPSKVRQEKESHQVLLKVCPPRARV